MMQEYLHAEVEAEDLDGAVEEALAQLSCTRAEADIEVLQAPSSGLLGLFGGRSAKVRVRLHDRGAMARQIARRLLFLSDLNAEVELSSTGRQIVLNLVSRDTGRLIGRHGQTLDALQSLVGTITDRLTTERTPIVLDVDGYRGRRQTFLVRLARRLSSKVRQSRKPASSPPLVITERRILHEMFKKDPDLESYSKNLDGGRKSVVIRLRG